MKQQYESQLLSLEEEQEKIISESRQTIMQLQYQIQSLSQQLNAQKDLVVQREADINQIRQLFEKKLGILTNQNRQLSAEASQKSEMAKIQTDQQRADLELLHQQCEQKLQLQAESFKSQISLLTMKLQQQQKVSEDVRNDKQVLLQQAVEDMKNLNLIIQELNQKNCGLKAERKHYMDTNLIMESENRRLRVEAESFNGQIQNLQERNARLVKELVKVDKMIYGNGGVSKYK